MGSNLHHGLLKLSMKFISGIVIIQWFSWTTFEFHESIFNVINIFRKHDTKIWLKIMPIAKSEILLALILFTRINSQNLTLPTLERDLPVFSFKRLSSNASLSQDLQTIGKLESSALLSKDILLSSLSPVDYAPNFFIKGKGACVFLHSWQFLLDQATNYIIIFFLYPLIPY